MKRRIAVIGGGPAGMTAAIRAAEAGALVTLYERNGRVGKKLLSTGNGRCNFSNEKMGEDCYHGSGKALLSRVFAEFGPVQTKAWFASLGMRIKERDGCLYPASDQASTVLDLLRFALTRGQVTVHTDRMVKRILHEKGKFTVEESDPAYDAVILACGGSAAPATGSDGNGFLLAKALGHRIVPVVPALTALRCREDFLKQTAGVRCDATLTLRIDGTDICTEGGELQLTDYGISGIPTFQISRLAAYALREKKKVTVSISFLPGFDAVSCKAFLRERIAGRENEEMEMFLTGIVNKKISQLLLKLSGIRRETPVSAVHPEAFGQLAALYCGLEVTITDTNPFSRAQISAGGVDCAQVTERLMSEKVPGLYFAGEILDIDGLCGGYNLQWAWSSGTVAGRAASRGTEESGVKT